MRPISAVVDITNFVSFDLARPLHAFDAAKLRGKLRVHLAKGGEELKLLNGKVYTLQPGMTIISDDSGPLELSAIMGGESTSCESGTTEILLISAYFDPIRTARGGRALGITSDARYRFERGIDPAFCKPGAEISTPAGYGTLRRRSLRTRHRGRRAFMAARARPAQDARRYPGRRRCPARRAKAHS